MPSSIFNSIFDAPTTSEIGITDFLICLGAALVLGIILTVAIAFRSRFTKSFAMTLALLPAIVCVVIMMVNGHIGAGVAVAGAFSLVRFRSVPGTAREIAAIFLAMCVGLVCGMGYLAFAAVFTVIMSPIFAIYNCINIGDNKQLLLNKIIRITIPEDLDYTGVFDDILSEYTSSHSLIQVKSTNMGSMFRLTYSVTLKDLGREKELIDKLRTRNGNLEISISIKETTAEL